MTTPVIQRILAGKEWWASHDNNDDASLDENKSDDALYRHFMVSLAAQEERRLKAERADEAKASKELEAQKVAAVLRAEAHNLLAHSPDAWWDLLRDDASPPTVLVALTAGQATSLMRLLRNLCRATTTTTTTTAAGGAAGGAAGRPRRNNHGNHSRESAIDDLLVECQAALNFDTKRRTKGPQAAVTIQRLVLQFLARVKVRRLILTRFEKTWVGGQGGRGGKTPDFVYVDTVGQEAKRAWETRNKQSNRGGGGGVESPGGHDDDDDDDDERPPQSKNNKTKAKKRVPKYTPPPWPLQQPKVPSLLKSKRFNFKIATTAAAGGEADGGGQQREAQMGTPRAIQRKLHTEEAVGVGRLGLDREVRPTALAAMRKREAHLRDLCSLAAVLDAIRAASNALADQWLEADATRFAAAPDEAALKQAEDTVRVEEAKAKAARRAAKREQGGDSDGDEGDDDEEEATAAEKEMEPEERDELRRQRRTSKVWAVLESRRGDIVEREECALAHEAAKAKAVRALKWAQSQQEQLAVLLEGQLEKDKAEGNNGEEDRRPASARALALSRRLAGASEALAAAAGALVKLQQPAAKGGQLSGGSSGASSESSAAAAAAGGGGGVSGVPGKLNRHKSGRRSVRAAAATSTPPPPPCPEVTFEQRAACTFFCSLQAPWPSCRASTSAHALKAVENEHEALKRAFVEKARAAVRRKRGGAMPPQQPAGGAAAGGGGKKGKKGGGAGGGVGVSSGAGSGTPRVEVDVQGSLSGTVAEDLFGGWGRPQALDDLAQAEEQAQKEAEEEAQRVLDANDEEEEEGEDEEGEEEEEEDGEAAAELRATAKQKSAWKELAKKQKAEDKEQVPLSEYLKQVEAEAGEKLELELEAAAMSGEVDQRSSDQQLKGFKQSQTERLCCDSPADACRVLLRDAAAVLGALCSASRVYVNHRCWPHRELFPLGLVLTKKVAALDPQALGLRALLAGTPRTRGLVSLVACASKGGSGLCAAPSETLARGQEVATSVGKYFENQTNRYRNVLKSLHSDLGAMPSPPPPVKEYREAHDFLVEKGLRDPNAVEVSMLLLEEMANVRTTALEAAQAKRNGRALRALPLKAFCSTGTVEEDPWGAVEVVPPYSLARWGMRCHASKFDCLANNTNDGGGGGGVNGGLLPAASSLVGTRRREENKKVAADNSLNKNKNKKDHNQELGDEDKKGAAAAAAGSAGALTDDSGALLKTQRSSSSSKHDPSPVAIERALLANSVVVDLVADPFSAQKGREAKHQRSGHPQHQLTPFAANEVELYVTRVYLFRKTDPGEDGEGEGGGGGGESAAAAAGASTVEGSCGGGGRGGGGADVVSGSSRGGGGSIISSGGGGGASSGVDYGGLKDVGPYPKPVDPEAVALQEKAAARKAKEKAAVRAEAKRVSQERHEPYVDPWPDSEGEDEVRRKDLLTRPLPFEKAKFVNSFGCEHGRGAPALSFEAPPLALFDWRECGDAALLLGEDSAEQSAFAHGEDSGEVPFGWLGASTPYDPNRGNKGDGDVDEVHQSSADGSGGGKLPNKKSGLAEARKKDQGAAVAAKKKLKLKDASAGGGQGLLELPAPPTLLPSAAIPAAFTYREKAPGGSLRFFELRLRARPLTTAELRPLLPGTLHPLLVKDGSEEESRLTTADNKDISKGSKKKGKKEGKR